MSDEQISETAALLEQGARAANMFLSGDSRVSECDAALLLGLSAGHLKALRLEGAGPEFYRTGIGGGKVSYRIVSLAAWLEGKRNQTADNVIDAEG